MPSAHPHPRRAVAAALSVATVLTTALWAVPSAGAAPAADPTPPARDEVAEKVTDEVAETLAEEVRADFWVQLADRPDLEPAKDIADWGERGRYVYDALVKNAEQSQAGVVAQLEAAGVEYQTFWISNAIHVQDGTEALAERVAAGSDVALVHEEIAMELVDPPTESADPTGRTAADERATQAAEAAVTWGIDEMNADDVWDLGFTGEGITVAGFDTGVDLEHPALRAKYRGTQPDGSVENDYNWYDRPGLCSGSPCDPIINQVGGHGTHTMGTMVGDDGADHQIGVAPDARWIATNCVDRCANSMERADYLRSAQWLLAPTRADGSDPDPAMRPHVVNNSWGIPQSQEDTLPIADWMGDETEAWEAAGIFGVWAAGNEGEAGCESGRLPARYPHTYSVSAYDAAGDIAYFSSRGPGTDGKINPNIAAPGVDVLSALPGGGYGAGSGTSMAAPHVAGVVALLWSAVPSLVGDIESTKTLLDGTAHDTEDLTCGGTAEDNNVWGEGKIDALALVQEALASGGAGTLAGTVTDADGEPVAGATVAAEGRHSPRTVTGRDGTYSMSVIAGDYEVTTSAFGYLPSSARATVAVDATSTLDATLTAARRYDVTGTVVDPDGAPVPNADVSVDGTPLDAVRTGADGTFTVPAVPEGEYTLAVRPNACLSPATTAFAVDGAESLTVTVDRVVDLGGYTCSVSEGEYRRGTDRVEITNGVWADVALPFPIAFYNGTHETLNIGRRGVITTSASDTAGPGSGGAAIFPFWISRPLTIDDQGGVYTGTTTVDGQDAYVVEYRNVQAEAVDNVTTARISFSVTITRSGTVIIAYGDGVGEDGPLSAGSTATTGIQGWAGVDGIRFSQDAPVLRDGMVVTYDLPDFGYLDATVVDENDGLPVEGADVAFTRDGRLVESVVTNGTGLVHRQLPTGDYTMTVTAPDYVTRSYEFSLDELYAKARVDARLATGVADLATDGLDTVLGTDQHDQGSLTLTNTGSAPVTFDLAEVARHPELDGAGATTSTLKGANGSIDLAAWKSGSTREHTASSVDAGTQGAAAGKDTAADTLVTDTLAGGDVITRFKPSGKPTEGEPSGLGYDGDVWVHDYDAKTNTAFTVTGKKAGKSFAADWNPDYRAFDMELDTLTGDMCQMEDSPASYIHCFDTETGIKTREIKGDWSTLQLTGLAYDAGRDVFYVGGRINGMIGTVAGTSHETPGELLSFCAPPLPQVMGLAYNEASDTIWYTDLAGGRSRLLQVDPVDCSLVNAWWFPEPKPYQGGGLATDASGALWATDQISDEVLLVDVEDDQVTDLPWLSLSTTGGTLAPGESTTVDVSVSTDDVEPGTLAANIVVRSDAGRQSKEYVPVTVTTTAYQVAVNAGGPDLTDGAGFAWSADRAHRDGGWGYEGRTRTVSTRSAIAGTSDDALFQTQRTPVRRDLTYVFDDAPAGTYRVDLGFAEIEKAARGKRVFDVLVDGSLEHYAYDPAGTAGQGTADVRTAVVEHDGGPLTVELRGTNGLRAPSIATLLVTLDPREAEAPQEPAEPERPEDVPVSPAGRTYEEKVTTGLYREGTVKSPWTGTGGCGPLFFTFDFPFYDTTWDGVCVSPAGMLTFDRSRSSWGNTDLPSSAPVDALYPFWDDLEVDDAAGIYLGVTEVDGQDAQVIEYRDVTFQEAPGERVSFSVTLVADGRIQIGYGPGVGGENPLTKGSSATIGVESLTGAHQVYSYEEATLTAGTGLEYTLPASGTLEGTVTDANDGKPVAGAVVTLTAPDGGTRTITTTKQGRWKAQALLGESTVEVWSPDYVATTGTVTLAEGGQTRTLDTELTTGVAEVSGDELDWLLGPDQTATAEVQVTNTGSAPLKVSFAEQERGQSGSVDLPWLALSGAPLEGPTVLAVGESTAVTATVDTSGTTPGELTGDVLVASNAGRDGSQLLPVTLGSSAYWLGVDVGGKGLTGADGTVWSADQALDRKRPGATWGHVGGKVRTTRADIAGTDDDQLFRTQRTGRTFSYVFEDVPAGTYQVGLGFAELDRVPVGGRAFDVLVDGEAVLYEHDVQAAVGRLAADTHTATVEHAGGDLTVELVGELGDGDPVLSSLTVREDPRG
ncbi:carboxypeptidase regulatory-like domain-containing protein [Promicromonospora sp. NPDC090134]|uniref:carboxypeptidase regulatory-like domain-containing protein n=1 Tax=Promicromonospora sp. NPDC090134 TaxID=3364408 RepID=UPI0037F53071